MIDNRVIMMSGIAGPEIKATELGNKNNLNIFCYEHFEKFINRYS